MDPLPEITFGSQQAAPSPGPAAGLPAPEFGGSARTEDQQRSHAAANFIFGDTKERFAEAQSSLDTGGVRTQYAAPDMVDPFAAQKGYQSVNFDPHDYAANVAHAARNESWGDAIWKGLKGMGHTAWQSFSSGPESTMNAAASVATLGIADLDSNTDAERLKAYYEDEDFRNKNRVFDESHETVASVMTNLGFSVGTMGYMAAEFAVTELLTGWATGGASGFVGVAKNLPLLGRAVRTIGKAFEAGEGVVDAARIAERAKQATQAAEALRVNRMGEAARTTLDAIYEPVVKQMSNPGKIQSMWARSLQLAEKVPVLGDVALTAREIGQARRLGGSGTDLLRLGFNGYKRLVKEMGAASNEASMETVQTYGDLYKKLCDQEEARTGGPLDEATLRGIMDTASKASAANFSTNMGLLLVSNKIQFGNLFRRFNPASKFLSDIVNEGGEKAFAVTGKKAGQQTTRVYRKGALGEISSFGKIKSDFGTGVAFKRAGISTLKGLGRIEGVEGLQEIGQETSNNAWQGYFEDVYDKIPTSVGSHVADALGGQMSAQGLETFLMGATTGMMLRPFHYATDKAMEKMNDLAGRGSAADRTEARKSFDDSLKVMNHLFEKPQDAFKDSIRNYRKQYESSANMAKAGKIGDRYTFGNEQTDALFEAVRAARATGMDKVLARTVRSMGDVFTDEEFKDAFGMDVKDTRHHDVKGFVKKIADDIDTYGQTIDDLQRQFKPIIDEGAFKSDERKLAYQYQRHAQDRAIEAAAYYKIRSGDAAERAMSIMDSFIKYPGFGKSSDYAFRVLTNKKNLAAEQAILRSDIAAMKGATDADTRKLRREKGEELAKLDDWQKHFNEEGGFLEDEPMTRRRVKLFTDILNMKNSQAGLQQTPVSQQDVQNAMKDLSDFTNLDGDTRHYMESLNALVNPDYFKKVTRAIGEGSFKAAIRQQLLGFERMVQGAPQADRKIPKKDLSNRLRQYPAYQHLMAMYEQAGPALMHGEYIQSLVKDIGDWIVGQVIPAGPEAAQAATQTATQAATQTTATAAAPTVSTGQTAGQTAGQQQATTAVQPTAQPAGEAPTTGPVATESEELFQVVDNGDGTGTVIDSDAKVVAESVPVQEAKDMVDGLNQGQKVIQTLEEFIKAELTNSSDRMEFQQNMRLHMKAHNAETGEDIKSVDEFMATPAGKKAARSVYRMITEEDIPEAVMNAEAPVARSNGTQEPQQGDNGAPADSEQGQGGAGPEGGQDGGQPTDSGPAGIKPTVFMTGLHNSAFPATAETGPGQGLFGLEIDPGNPTLAKFTYTGTPDQMEPLAGTEMFRQAAVHEPFTPKDYKNFKVVRPGTVTFDGTKWVITDRMKVYFDGHEPPASGTVAESPVKERRVPKPEEVTPEPETEKPVKVSKPRKVKKKPAGAEAAKAGKAADTSFEATGTKRKAGVTKKSLEDLHKKLIELDSEALQNRAESDNFVIEQLEKDLQDLFGCLQ